MSLSKEMAKAFSSRQGARHLAPYWYERPGAKVPVGFRKIVTDNVRPYWFRYFKGPWERWEYNNLVRKLRDNGLMMDDVNDDRDVMMERAIDLLPHDLAVARYRRHMRHSTMYIKRKQMPEDQINYDPMVPYLAPYVEEAKFMLQEELELCGYHNWDRSLYKGGVTGFGEKDPGHTLSSTLW